MSQHLRTKVVQDQLPAPSSARVPCQSGCISWLENLKGKGQATHGRPATAAGNRSVPATINGTHRRAGLKREYPPAAPRGTTPDGSRQSQFLSNNFDTAHEVGKFLPGGPSRRLAQAAIGGKRELF